MANGGDCADLGEANAGGNPNRACRAVWRSANKNHHFIAVMAEIIPKMMPGVLHTMIGQSFLTFKEPYKIHAVQFIVVITGNITDPGWPERLSLIWSM